MSSRTGGITLIILSIISFAIILVGMVPFSWAEAETSLPLGISVNAQKAASGNNTNFTGTSYLSLSLSINISDSYTSISAKRLAGEENSTRSLINILPSNYTLILLHLPRAEQNEILGMAPADAMARLSRYKLVTVPKAELYTERQVPGQVAAEVAVNVTIAAGPKAVRTNLAARLQEFLARLNIFNRNSEADRETQAAKVSLTDTIDLYTKVVESIKYNAEMSSDLTNEEANSITDKADLELVRLGEIRQQATDAKNMADVAAARNEAKILIQQLEPTIKSDSISLMQTRLSEVVKRNEEMERKLECSLDSMNGMGINTSGIDEKLNELSAKISFAKEDLRNAAAYNNAGNFTPAESKTMSAQLKLEDAYITLKDIVKDIKASNGTIIDCRTDTPDTITTVEEN